MTENPKQTERTPNRMETNLKWSKMNLNLRLKQTERASKWMETNPKRTETTPKWMEMTAKQTKMNLNLN
jgi:hypothetical protein